MRAVTAWSIVSVISLLAAVGIAALAPRMAPVRQGNSHEFWRIATGVSLSPDVDSGWGGNAYFVDDTWAAYEWAHMHGSDMYRVLRSDVSADFDAVVSLLEQSDKDSEETLVLRAFTKWRNSGKQLDGPGLLKAIEQERNRLLIEEDMDHLVYRVANEQQFWRRWQRTDWYWASIVFEWAFLTGVAIFARVASHQTLIATAMVRACCLLATAVLAAGLPGIRDLLIHLCRSERWYPVSISSHVLSRSDGT